MRPRTMKNRKAVHHFVDRKRILSFFLSKNGLGGPVIHNTGDYSVKELLFILVFIATSCCAGGAKSSEIKMNAMPSAQQLSV